MKAGVASQMTKQLALIAIITTLGISATGLAGKEDRDYMKNEVMPAVKKAETTWKSACGCALKITVDETTITSANDGMQPARDFCGTITENVAGYCTDDASKKAMCKMKSLTIKRAPESVDLSFTFKGGTGIATVRGISAPSWAMVTSELDK